MLTVEEIKMFIDEDAASVKKHFARTGERYFDGDHDIKNYRMFYYNSDGQLVEDTSRANVKIPHPFFKELTEQGTQYTLSGSDGFVFSDIPELQNELDARFNNTLKGISSGSCVRSWRCALMKSISRTVQIIRSQMFILSSHTK